MAHVDYFLKIDGIDGEAQDHAHKNEISIESWSFGATNAASGYAGGGGGAGKVSVQDMHFTSKLNKASTGLMLSCATGKHIANVLLTCRKAGEKPIEYLKIKLQDVLVSSYQTGGSAHGDVVPVDQFSLNFAKFHLEYAEQKADGSAAPSLKAGYDLKANKKL
jgi:type VI secretion system secreted protein Hcp